MPELVELTPRAVCEAARDARASGYEDDALSLLIERTGEGLRTCQEALRSARRSGLIHCSEMGDSAQLTVAGEKFLEKPDPFETNPSPFAVIKLNDLKVVRFIAKDDLLDALIALNERDIRAIPVRWSELTRQYVPYEVCS